MNEMKNARNAQAVIYCHNGKRKRYNFDIVDEKRKDGEDEVF